MSRPFRRTLPQFQTVSPDEATCRRLLAEHRSNRATPAADGAISRLERWSIGTYSKPPPDITRYLGEFCSRTEFRKDPPDRILDLAWPRGGSSGLGSVEHDGLVAFVDPGDGQSDCLVHRRP